MYFDIKKLKKISFAEIIELSQKYDVDVEYVYCLFKDIHNID